MLGGVCVRTVTRLCDDGQLNTFPVRGRAMIKVDSLERYLGLSDEPEATAVAVEKSKWDGCEIPALDNLIVQRQLRQNREAA